MLPWGTWEARYGSGSMFTSDGPAYYTGYSPVYYTAAYGPSYYNGGLLRHRQLACSGGDLRRLFVLCVGLLRELTSAGYGYDWMRDRHCGDGCAGGCNGCGRLRRSRVQRRQLCELRRDIVGDRT